MRPNHTSIAYEDVTTSDLGHDDSVMSGSVYSGYNESDTRSVGDDYGQENQFLSSAEWRHPQQDRIDTTGMPAESFAEYSGGPGYPPEYRIGFDHRFHTG